jgi:hypothetical protein
MVVVEFFLHVPAVFVGGNNGFATGVLLHHHRGIQVRRGVLRRIAAPADWQAEYCCDKLPGLMSPIFNSSAFTFSI